MELRQSSPSSTWRVNPTLWEKTEQRIYLDDYFLSLLWQGINAAAFR